MWREDGKVKRTDDVAAWVKNEMDFTGLVTNKSLLKTFRELLEMYSLYLCWFHMVLKNIFKKYFNIKPRDLASKK